MAGQEAEELEPQDGAPKPLEVDLSEPEADDDAPAAAGGEEKPSKKERREAFRAETVRERNAANERAAALERQVAQLQGQLNGFAAAQPRPQQPQADEGDAEVEGMWEQQQGILAQMRANPAMPETEVARLQRQFRSIDAKRRAKEATNAVRTAMQQQPQSGGLTQEDIDNRILASEFPDIMGDPSKRLRATAEMMDLVKQGKPYGLATAREAAAKIRGPVRRVPAVNEADKAKFTSQASAPGGGSGSQRFTPNRLQIASARAYCDASPARADLPDEEKVKIWAKEVGKKHGLI